MLAPCFQVGTPFYIEKRKTWEHCLRIGPKLPTTGRAFDIPEQHAQLAVYQIDNDCRFEVKVQFFEYPATNIPMIRNIEPFPGLVGSIRKRKDLYPIVEPAFKKCSETKKAIHRTAVVSKSVIHSFYINDPHTRIFQDVR